MVFPGLNGSSRSLWDTTYNNWGPRLGAAYQVDSNTVFRAGYGITYLPSNSGYFASGVDYGTSSFSSGTMQLPYGLSPSGVPVLHFWDDTPAEYRGGRGPLGSRRSTEVSANKFDRHFKNGVAQQWNFFIERTFARSGSCRSATALPTAQT